MIIRLIRKITYLTFIILMLQNIITVNNIQAQNNTTAGNPSAALELPAFTGPVYFYSGFTVQYCEETENAAWAAWELTRSEVKGRIKRSNDYREDPAIKTGSALLTDYYKSGYDRGHLAPAGDMKWSEKAMSESFLLSNITPQHRDLNRGIWLDLEELSRRWALYNGSLLIAAGPVYGENRKTIGESRVTVPDYFFKVIVDYRKPEYKGIGFIFPNSRCGKDLKEYAVSIDEIERITGFDFFYRLPDEEERIIESELDTGKWFWD